MNLLLQQTRDISRRAGDAIMDIYGRDFGIYEKDDKSPLTEADLAAHKIIVAGLETISDLPILSEESADIGWETRKQWQRYWLVDPLDGTKEFIKKNGEFTVNIALIDNGKPVLGVVHAPAKNCTYFGATSLGAFIKDDSGERTILPKAPETGEVLKVVGSRSHQSPEITAFLSALDSKSELVAMGSSLKLCLVAEGKAHLYPRLGPTSEWDTGAAQAVVEAAGGTVTIIEDGRDTKRPLRYNQKDSVLNPYFLVSY